MVVDAGVDPAWAAGGRSTRPPSSPACVPAWPWSRRRPSALWPPCRWSGPSTRRCAWRTARVYGLAAVVLTSSMAHAQRAARELAVGTLKVNAAFGGAPGGAATPHGGSGEGFGYGPELLDELTRVRVVHVEPPPA
ncbi:MAG TPA: aldehyde dehydrogenase family protein [Acidimicrobiales bacterium]|nr:aldehyde dehydrogenase family protein [Acidimicrobiales bacterium]